MSSKVQKRRTTLHKKQLQELKALYPDADCALHHNSPFQLLVATILSAQCTDARVNQVTPGLFKKYPAAQDFARATPATLENDIRSTGFFRQKARWIQSSAQKIVAQFNNQIPQTMEELLTLSGVARKTANVVLGTAFGKAVGVVVDTHVKRIAKRLGWTKHTDPVKVESDLMKLLPQREWIWISHALIQHGRRICKAPTPRCLECSLKKICPSAL